MNKRGFTLVEILISTVIIAVLAGGMFSAFVGAQYIFNRARHRMQALNFAREVQDKLRSNYGYDETVYTDMAFGTHDPSDIDVSILGDLEPLIIEDGFTYKVYTYAEGSQVDGYKKVIVRVTWDETTL